MNILNIRQIRKYLSYEAVKTLVQCTVTVYIRFDYCNGLHCGLPLKTIKIQLAQNAAARLIAKISPRESTSNTLTDRSSLASCDKAMSIQVNGANLHHFTWYYTSLHYVTCSIGTTHQDH